MLEEVANSQEQKMVTKKELEGMTGKQLQKLIAEVQALQMERRAGRIQELRQKWAAEAEEEGFTVIEVLGIRKENGRKPKGDGTRAPAKMKYRLPDGTEWSGKGRLPLALRDALKGTEGYSEKDASFDSKEARAKALEKYLI